MLLQLNRHQLFYPRLSVSNDLKYDAQQDLYNIGAQFIEVHPLNKVLQSKKVDGSL
jgi:hypothetical protein